MRFLLLLLLLQTQTPTLDKLIQELLLLKGKGETVVTTSAQLQAALDSDAEVISVAVGDYVGNFKIRVKPTKTLVRGLAFNGRAKPEYAYPKLIAQDRLRSVLENVGPASNYTFQGLEFTGVAPDRDTVTVGQLTMTSLAEVPANILFDQVYIHGVNSLGHRGLQFNVTNGVVVNSYFSEFVEIARDSQAIMVANGPGPYIFANNYLEASGENILFGGSDPGIPNLTPSDITIEDNLFFKPLDWKLKFPHSVKNLFEIKHAKNVKIRNNVFENVWADNQSGDAVIFNVRNQSSRCPWCNIENVEFGCNVIRNAGNFAVNVLGMDTNYPSGTMKNLTITNNLMVDVANGIFINGGLDLTISLNSIYGVKGRFLGFDGLPTLGFKFLNNTVISGANGITGKNTTLGTPTLDFHAPGYIFTDNTVEITPLRKIAYPAGTILVQPGTLRVPADWDCK